MAAGQLVDVDAVNFRIAQMAQAQAQWGIWAEEFYTWQAALTGAAIEALPAGSSGKTFVSGDGANIKGFGTEAHLLNQVRQGLMYVPSAGSPTAGSGYNFTSFFTLMIGIGV